MDGESLRSVNPNIPITARSFSLGGGLFRARMLQPRNAGSYREKMNTMEGRNERLDGAGIDSALDTPRSLNRKTGGRGADCREFDRTRIELNRREKDGGERTKRGDERSEWQTGSERERIPGNEAGRMNGRSRKEGTGQQ